MDAIPEWSLSEDATAIERTFSLKHFKETMFLANGIAAIAEREGHHPDMTVTYNTLTVRISTHAIGGLSENDFILAAKIDSLIAA
jgi:4a-hydroxytetrahydrobiopterin dehydratase